MRYIKFLAYFIVFYGVALSNLYAQSNELIVSQLHEQGFIEQSDIDEMPNGQTGPYFVSIANDKLTVTNTVRNKKKSDIIPFKGVTIQTYNYGEWGGALWATYPDTLRREIKYQERSIDYAPIMLPTRLNEKGYEGLVLYTTTGMNVYDNYKVYLLLGNMNEPSVQFLTLLDEYPLFVLPILTKTKVYTNDYYLINPNTINKFDLLSLSHVAVYPWRGMKPTSAVTIDRCNLLLGFKTGVAKLNACGYPPDEKKWRVFIKEKTK